MNVQAELTKEFKTFPDIIIQSVTGLESKDIEEDTFFYKTFMYDCGARLLSIAGLATCGLYVHNLKHEQDFPRDPIFEDHLRQIVFGNGYNWGIACSVIQRAGHITKGSLGKVIKDDRPLTDFVQSSYSKKESAGTRVREELKKNVYLVTLDMLPHISFLKDFQFKDGRFHYCNEIVDLEPYLLWDDNKIWHIQKIRIESNEMQYIALSGDRRFSKTINISAEHKNKLRILAEIIGVDDHFGEIIKPDGMSKEMGQSILPLFADTYPAMTRLASKLWECSEEQTRIDLWVDPTVSSEEAYTLANDAIYITNAIIKKCIEADPITVLENFFYYEPKDFKQYLKHLVTKSEEIKKIHKEIEEDVKKHIDEFRKFVYRDQDIRLNEMKRKWRAQLRAKTMAKLIGFSVIETTTDKPLGTYVENVMAFSRLLYKQKQGIREDVLRDGILECCTMAENILRFLIKFYLCVPYFVETSKGIDINSLEEIQTNINKTIERKGLGQLIGLFRKVGKNEDIKKLLSTKLDRPSIWREGSHTEHFTFLNELNTWRNERVHGRSPGNWADTDTFIDSYLRWLDWLGGNPRIGEFCIYPVILNLKVISTNRCGITTLQYAFQEIIKGREVEKGETKLYTRQQLSAELYYYALPHMTKTHPDIWVEPLLISSDVLNFPD